jgi:AcrR family transcriptional regulator
VSRWTPDARGRLERAGLTTRTFFRYFADKREVLFASDVSLRDRFAEIIRTAPAELTGVDLMRHIAETAGAELFEPRFEDLRTWRSVVGGEEALRERQLRKQQLLIDAAVASLRDRGYDERTADVLAALGVTLFQDAVTHWLAQPAPRRRLAAYVGESFEVLRDALGAPSAPPTPAERRR